MGSSIGLDRPMGAILNDIANALDLSRTFLFDWVGVQPCPTTASGQTPNSLTWGVAGAWTGITCNDDTTNKEGGISTISLNSFGFTGSIHTALRDLRTLRNGYFSNNMIQGSLPQARARPGSPSASWSHCGGQRTRGSRGEEMCFHHQNSPPHFVPFPSSRPPRPRAVLGPDIRHQLLRQHRRLHPHLLPHFHVQQDQRRPAARAAGDPRAVHVQRLHLPPLRKLSHGARRTRCPLRSLRTALAQRGRWPELPAAPPDHSAAAPVPQGTIPASYATVMSNAIGIAFNPGALPFQRALPTPPLGGQDANICGFRCLLSSSVVPHSVHALPYLTAALFPWRAAAAVLQASSAPSPPSRSWAASGLLVRAAATPAILAPAMHLSDSSSARSRC